MDGNREILLNRNWQLEPIKIPVRDVEKDKTPTMLSSKFSQIRADVCIRSEKISLLAKTLSTEDFINKSAIEIVDVIYNYEKFLDEILGDKTIIDEVQRVYADPVVVPISEDDFSELELQYIVEDNIIEFVEKIVALDLAMIKDSVSSILIDSTFWDQWDQTFLMFFRERMSGEKRNKYDLANTIVGKPLSEYYKNESTNMRVWGALRSSPAINNIFGDLIQFEDDKKYTTALENSLRDDLGFDIDTLLYYPTPDTIRNIVLLAAADFRNFRTVHANEVLCAFARRSDWVNILDNAEQLYPALRSVRPVLEEWKHFDSSSKPDIQDKVLDFTVSFVEGEQKDEHLYNLALEAIPNRFLLSKLVKRGMVTEGEFVVLRDAELFVGRKSAEDWYAIPTYFNNYSLKNAIRKNLLNLLNTKQSQGDSEIDSIRRLVILSQRILDNQTNTSALEFLTSDEIVDVIANKQIQPELIFAIPEQIKLLMDNRMIETRTFIYQHCETLLKDVADLRFINNLIGEFGQKSDSLIRSYQECLTEGIIVRRDRRLVLEFLRQFRAISPALLGGYKEAKEAGHDKVYIAQLITLSEKMTGYGIITDKERAMPYYKDLLKHVYSNNVGYWSSFELNESCNDRSGDIVEFKIKSRYEIDLLSQSETRIKDGEMLDPKVQDEVQKPIYLVSERMSELGYDYEKIKQELKIAIDVGIDQILHNGGLKSLDFNLINSPEERLFLILTDSIYGTKALDKASVKNLLITYEFAYFEDISDYIAGIRDRISRANNQDYALLCETGAFYLDRVKEINRKLVEFGFNNTAIAEMMPGYFKNLAEETIALQRQDNINRLQVDRLGLSDRFVREVGKLLVKRNGRKYELDEIRRVISKYEGIAGGLIEKTSTSLNVQTRAFYGQLRSQREKTFIAMKQITDEVVDPVKIHLGEINLQQLLDVEANMREGKYDEGQFASYTSQRFIDLFDEERTKIEKELDKFESLTGKKREVLYANITKTKDSAHARMAGGVCVAGDNPGKDANRNMWNMPNYFQLVFQEPETLQCQGLAMLHYFNEGEKKVLTVSINPSSTYLYSIDEASLFAGIMGTLEQFAVDNGFDLITISQSKSIRTNRIGGQFEIAMDERIAQVGKTFRFDTLQQFSYNPKYQLQDMDVVWEKNSG